MLEADFIWTDSAVLDPASSLSSLEADSIKTNSGKLDPVSSVFCFPFEDDLLAFLGCHSSLNIEKGMMCTQLGLSW